MSMIAATPPAWAEPKPDLGSAVYQLTKPPREHKHAYHTVCPWSSDQRDLALIRYDRTDPEADICLLSWETGDIRPIGTTRRWNWHSGAFQQWQGNRRRVVYTDMDGDQQLIVSRDADGDDHRVYPVSIGMNMVSPDGSFLVGHDFLYEAFPNDELGDRSRRGMHRLDLETGETSLIVSVDQALAVTPDREQIKDYHLFLKMSLIHRSRPLILFGMVNAIVGVNLGEPLVKYIYAVNVDGSDLRFLGRYGNHPNWHPTEPLVIANTDDDEGRHRYALYDVNRPGEIDFVEPYVKKSGGGHPAFNPDGTLFSNDGSDGDYRTLNLYGPSSGRSWRALRSLATARGGYGIEQRLANRPPGQGVAETVGRGLENNVWTSHGHCAWSRDGQALLCNCDHDGSAQLCMIHVPEAIKAKPEG